MRALLVIVDIINYTQKMCILVHISHFCEFLILNPFTVSCESHLQPQWRTRHFILGVQNFWGQGTNCGPRTSPSGGLGPNSPDAKTLSLSFSFWSTVTVCLGLLLKILQVIHSDKAGFGLLDTAVIRITIFTN